MARCPPQLPFQPALPIRRTSALSWAGLSAWPQSFSSSSSFIDADETQRDLKWNPSRNQRHMWRVQTFTIIIRERSDRLRPCWIQEQTPLSILGHFLRTEESSVQLQKFIRMLICQRDL